ncbi:MAG: hypothetical protein K9M08_17670 [Pirellula sp.]|nr:hypothetical protein [Pirellula sp.]
MNLLLTILAASTSLVVATAAVLGLMKSNLELKTASLKYETERKNDASLVVDRSTTVKSHRPSMWPHPLVLILAVISFVLTLFAVSFSGPTSTSSIFLMTVLFLSMQLVFLHMAFNHAFRLASDIHGVMGRIIDVMDRQAESLSDVSSSQFKVTEIAERALAMAERAVPPTVQLNTNNNGSQTKASSERS